MTNTKSMSNSDSELQNQIMKSANMLRNWPGQGRETKFRRALGHSIADQVRALVEGNDQDYFHAAQCSEAYAMELQKIYGFDAWTLVKSPMLLRRELAA